MANKAHYELFRTIAVPTIYLQMLNGDAEAAILLSQLLYWSDKTRNPEGWIYKSYKEWYGEIGFSESKCRRAAGALERLGYIQTMLKRANSAPTLHYRVNLPVFAEALDKFVAQRSGELLSTVTNPESRNSGLSNSLIIKPDESAETLTETTTDTDYLKNCAEDFFEDDNGSANNSAYSPPLDLPVLVIGPRPVVEESREVSHDIPGISEVSGEDGAAEACAAGMITGMDKPQTLADVRPPADDSDPVEVLRWFREMDDVKERTAKPARSADDVRAGVGNALIASAARQTGAISEFVKSGISEDASRDILNFLSGIPEDLVPLAREFCRLFRRAPLKREKAGWISEFRTQSNLGIGPGDIAEAFREANKSELTIKAPISLTSIAEKYMRKRGPSGTLPGERKFKRRVIATAGGRQYLPGLEDAGG